MKEVTIYTDGACSGNPGAGGWCCILTYNEAEKTISGGAQHTTNNKMELQAVIEGLNKLKEPCSVKVVSDSLYVTDPFNKKWIYSWEKKGWKLSDSKPVKNLEQWQQLLSLSQKHNITFEHVKGHNGHKYNEQCDREAQKQAEYYRGLPIKNKTDLIQ